MKTTMLQTIIKGQGSRGEVQHKRHGTETTPMTRTVTKQKATGRPGSTH